MRWMFELVGDVQDLAQLAALFDEGAVSVIRKDDRFWMRSEAIDLVEDAGDARSEADGLVQTLNGVSALRVQGTGFARLGSMRRIDETGREDIYITPQSVRAVARAGLVKVLINDKPVPSQDGQLLSVAEQDPDLEQVVRIYGSRVPDWRDLYFILEVAEDAIGGSAAEAGWVSEAERERFSHTANNRRAIGDLARHGHAKFAPPARPMTLADARSLIAELVRAWMRSKLDPP